MLVHGFASSFEHNWRQTGWVDILGDLDRPVVGVDLLGHGTAPRPVEPSAYTGVVERVAGELPDGVVDAVGFSAGAEVVLRLAVLLPERFGRIALLGVGDNIFDRGDVQPLIDALSGAGDPDDVQGRLFRHLAASAGNDSEPLVAFLRRDREPLRPDELGAVAATALVVLGARDFIGSADQLVAALPDARLKTLARADHFSTPSDFDAIDAVVRFLGPS